MVAYQALPNATYLDLTSYQGNAPLPSGTPLTGSFKINVALVLERANDPTKLLEADWGSRQKQLAELNAKQTERGMVLTLGDVLFDTGQSTLKAGAQSTIDRLAEFLRSSPESTVVIEGHTDSVGGEDYNMQLSQRRADAVGTELLNRNISGDRVTSAGTGESAPIASNDTDAGRQQNRRVEIIVSPPERK